jgi:hypothetical protein
MILNVPDSIDLTGAECYALTVFLHPEKWSILIFELDDPTNAFYAEDCPEQQLDVFASFKDWFFENELFASGFGKVYVVSLTNDFTFVPDEFDPQTDGKEFLQFLSSEHGGVTLYNKAHTANLFVVFSFTEAVYDFFCHSFAEPVFVHQLAPLIDFFSMNNPTEVARRMVICSHGCQLDLLCFDGSRLLLGNSYTVSQHSEAMYFILFTWKQLKFNQMEDAVLIDGDIDGKIFSDLKQYIRTVTTAVSPALLTDYPDIPTSLAVLTL